MQNSSWTKYFILSIVSIFSVIILVNYLINPYNIFSHTYEGRYNYFKPYVSSDRMTKFYEAKNLHPSTLLMGTSRIGFFKSTYMSSYAPKPIYNLALAGSSIYEQASYLEYMINHQNIKLVVWALDFYSFNPDKKNEDTFDINRLNKSFYYSDYITSLLNYRTFEKSIQTIKENSKYDYSQQLTRPLFEEAQYFNQQGQPYSYNEVNKNITATLNEYKNHTQFLKSTHFSNPHSIDPALKRVAYVINLCNEKHIPCIIYTSPVYVKHIDLIYSLNLGKTFNYWKRSLVTIHPYTDFCTYNSVTKNIMNFRDSSHIISDQGKIIFAKIFNDPKILVPQDFGYTITTQNITEHLNQQQKQQHEYSF